MTGPLLTLTVNQALQDAALDGASTLECSLDLELSRATVDLDREEWRWQGRRFPYLSKGRDRTIYHWTGAAFEPIARFTTSLIKLVPTQWGPPTFEIDGIKMLPTANVSPYEDAARKVALVAPRGKRILDTCAGLGYFAAWCAREKAAAVHSYEKNPDVIWLRTLNPWSPASGQGLSLIEGDITEHIVTQADASFEGVLHDPPRFGIAGELYSEAFYRQLARVLQRKARLYHYTGSPNRLTSGRDVRNEVATRLRRVGLATELDEGGVLATKK